MKDKKHRKVRNHCHYTWEYRGAVYNIFNLRYSVPKKITIVFHNGSNYDYRFIMEELAEKRKKQFICLGENTRKYITFTFQQKNKLHELIENGGKNHKKYILHITVY